MSFPSSSILSVRHGRVREALSELGLDALVVTAASNIRYLTNHAGSAGIVVVTPDTVHLLIDSRYEEAVRQLQRSPAACPTLEIWPVPASYDEALLDCLSGAGLSTVGFEAGQVTVARHAWWLGAMAARGLQVSLKPTEGLVERIRLIKDGAEITALREAARRLTPVAAEAMAEIRVGMPERELAGVIEGALRRAGFERPAFDTIVASGPNAALPHHRAGGRALAAGDLVVLDFGGVLDGYCSDLTRTVTIGPPTPEARRVYGAVLEAQEAARAAVRPGVEASDVDRAARQVLEAHGLGEAFGHGTGHGLGLDIHEDPRISRPRPDGRAIPLLPGMVFTIEPGAYLPGWGGVRIEDDILVTEEGCEVLTQVPRALRAID
jgi:Xaa-Pro aminopeptidase